jgi:hypothetical protein
MTGHSRFSLSPCCNDDLHYFLACTFIIAAHLKSVLASMLRVRVLLSPSGAPRSAAISRAFIAPADVPAMDLHTEAAYNCDMAVHRPEASHLL